MKKLHPTYRSSFLILGILFLFMACERKGCLQNAVNDKSMVLELEPFSEMDIRGMFDLRLIPDSQNYVEFITRESVFEYLHANIDEAGRLTLENANDCFYRRDYSKVIAEVHFNSLTRVNVHEAGKLSSEFPLTGRFSVTVQSDMAEVDLLLDTETFGFYNHTTTGGDFRLRGSSTHASLSVFYTARADFSAFTATSLRLHNGSVGDIQANALEKLEIEISHEGNIYYTGTPEIVIDTISGSGKLISLPR